MCPRTAEILWRSAVRYEKECYQADLRMINEAIPKVVNREDLAYEMDETVMDEVWIG